MFATNVCSWHKADVPWTTSSAPLGDTPEELGKPTPYFRLLALSRRQRAIYASVHADQFSMMRCDLGRT